MHIETRLIKLLKDSSIAAAVILFFAFLYLYNQNEPQNSVREIEYAEIIIRDSVTVVAEVARTEAETAKGLGGKEKLEEFEGMLFYFPENIMRVFWMKDMLIPIDIIWIGENMTIIDITNDVPIHPQLQTYSPKVPAQFVLELNAGFVNKNGISIGDTVTFHIE
jgi:uncharacterized membrane protein (UPF0127 family)